MIEHTLGDFQNHSSVLPNVLELRFNLNHLTGQRNWRKNHINSCFIAKYVRQIITDLNLDAVTLEASVSDTVNYVANELLEDAMLRHEGSEPAEIRISVVFGLNRIVMYVTNPVEADSLAALTNQLGELLDGDPANHYLQQLRKNNQPADQSDLRYLSMMVDHKVDLAWKIVHAGADEKHAYLTTMTSVPLHEIEQCATVA